MLEVFNTASPCALSKEATVDISPENLCKHCHPEVSNLTSTSFGHLVDRQYGFSSVFFPLDYMGTRGILWVGFFLSVKLFY